MYQASQKAVVQDANMVLINIRTAEVKYFSTFFGNFGTQAAIIAGAIVGALSQTPALHYNCNYFFIFIYFTCAATSLVLSCQVILSTLVASTFGQGYALRGPLGSMVITIDGMIAEQHQVLFTFVLAITFFELQTAAMYRIVMTELAGFISFFIILIGGCITYSYALRIYNRFHFQSDKVTWQDEGPASHDPVKALDDMISDDPTNRPNKVAAHNMNPRNYIRGNTTGQSQSGANGGNGGEVRKRKTILSRLLPSSTITTANRQPPDASMGEYDNYSEFGGAGDKGAPYVQMKDIETSSRADTHTVSAMHQIIAHNTQHSGGSGNSSSTNTSSSGQHSQILEGYMAVRNTKLLTMDPWERRYFVLQGSSIFYYKDRRSYQLRPEEPVNTRPIDLRGYSLIAGAYEPPFAISLVPLDADDNRKAWKFRCDTLVEFNNWIEKFRKALVKHGDDMSDLVIMSSGKSVYNGGTTNF
jgi:hypothetical protein